MDAILLYYFRMRIEKIQTSQTVSIGGTMSAEDVKSVDVNKEILEVLSTSLKIKAQPALLADKDLIDTIQNKMETLEHTITSEEEQEQDKKFDDIMALAITYFNIGLVYWDTKLNEFNIGKVYIHKCLKLLGGKQSEPKAIMTIIKVLNKLHTISYKFEQEETSYSLLDTAVEIYSEYTKKTLDYPDPINFSTILNKLLLVDDDEGDTNSKIVLENLHLTTLLNMSRLYEKNQHDKHKFVLYIYNILKEIVLEKVSILYLADYAVALCKLCSYFKHNHRFVEARNHMITAEYTIKTLHQKIKTINEEEKKLNLYTNIRKAHDFGYNFIIMYWGLYGTELLIASADGLLPREVNESCEEDNSKSESFVDSEENLLIFPGIEEKKQLLENFTAQFPDKCVSNVKDAKVIFVNVLKCSDIAKKYFTIEQHIINFMIIEMERSRLYNGLATFDKENKIKLYLKQLDILIKLETEQTINLLIELDHILYPYNFFVMIYENKVNIEITILNMKVEHLLLNVEQLDEVVTNDFETDIRQKVDCLISLFHSYITYVEHILEF